MLWTPGWGPRAWWHWLRTEKVPMAIAWTIPRSIALWVFIRVYGADGSAPGPEYVRVYNAWTAGAGR